MIEINLCNEVLENAIGVHRTLEEIEPLNPMDAVAVQAMEELLKYRAIGTVKEIKIREAQFARLSEGYLNDLTSLREYQTIGTVEECQQRKEYFDIINEVLKGYSDIGTIDEFKALKEKNEPKEMDRFYCPICRHYFEDTDAYNYCPVCGQKMKPIWQKGSEENE